MPSLAGAAFNQPDVTLGGLNMNSTEAEMLAEAAMLREHRARLENRMSLLEEHNRQLESQLGKLKQILEVTFSSQTFFSLTEDFPTRQTWLNSLLSLSQYSPPAQDGSSPVREKINFHFVTLLSPAGSHPHHQDRDPQHQVRDRQSAGPGQPGPASQDEQRLPTSQHQQPA